MTFLCQTCGKSFGSKAKLHVYNQIHSEKILTYKICDKTLIGIKSFNNHIKIHQTYEQYSDYFQWTDKTMKYEVHKWQIPRKSLFNIQNVRENSQV